MEDFTRVQPEERLTEREKKVLAAIDGLGFSQRLIIYCNSEVGTTFDDERIQAIADLSIDELQNFIKKHSCIFHVGMHKNNINWADIIKKANLILEKKIALKEESERIDTDDGSIRGLIIKNAYQYLNTSNNTFIRYIRNGNTVWIAKDEFENPYEYAFDSYGCTWKIGEKLAFNVRNIIEKKCSIQEMLLIAHNDISTDNPEIGILFTDAKMYFWENNSLQYIIDYDEIDSLLIEDSEYLLISVDAGQTASIYCGKSSNNYSRHLYKLLMDIKSRLTRPDK
ncbi:hypothetical protein [Butyrivibrio sp. NC2002]|uniref:hypothetical protein n=1 Tax=Butyrivibrio sp. NC2002 TaxID=1410610 RepID=UPI00056C1F69|nr:hypothetical protein [Butyrivibrio sp. NC2002]